jgi:hypothetical protein
MSLAEILEHVKKLPASEQAQFCSMTEKWLRQHDAASTEPDVRYATDAEFDAVSDRVFSENKELLRRLAQ